MNLLRENKRDFPLYIGITLVAGFLYLQSCLFVNEWARGEESFLLISGLAIFPLLFIYDLDEDKRSIKKIITAFLIAFIFVNFLHIGKKMMGNILSPRQWDFFDFYITGKIAAQGKNFYSTDLFKTIPLPMPPGEDFINEVLNVGSKYPPQTVLFYALFGFFDFTVSQILFFLVQFVFMILTAVEVSKIINVKDSRLSFLVALSLLFLIAGTWKTVEYLAPNFLPLYMVVKSYNVKSKLSSGILLGIAILFRPLFLIFFIDFLINKRIWKITGVILTIAVTSLLSLSIYGPETFMNYFIDGPFGKAPLMDIYGNYTFHALNSVLLRVGIIKPVWGSPWFHPLSMFFVVFVAILSFVLIIKKKGSYFDAVCLLTPWALIIYPETWWSYLVFLYLPLIKLFRNRKSLDPSITVAVCIPILFLINSFSYLQPNQVFSGSVLFAIAFTIWDCYGKKGKIAQP